MCHIFKGFFLCRRILKRQQTGDEREGSSSFNSFLEVAFVDRAGTEGWGASGDIAPGLYKTEIK
jgi:hypothetical protein